MDSTVHQQFFFERIERRLLLSADILPVAEPIDDAVIETAAPLAASPPDESAPQSSPVADDETTTESLQDTPQETTQTVADNSASTDTTTATTPEPVIDEDTSPTQEEEESSEPAIGIEETDVGSALETESGATEDVLPTEVIFINDSVAEVDQLVEELRQGDQDTPAATVILLDSNQDGVSQISATLESYQSLDAVHVFGHGASGSVQLGSTWLNEG